MTTGSDNVFPKVIFSEGSAPATPSSGQVKLYAKTDGLLYSKDDAGTETVVTGGAGGGTGTGFTSIVRKTADEVVNASATLQNDNHLLQAMLANEVYEFECQIWYDSGTTPDFKCAFTVPAAATLWWARHGATDSGDSVLGNGVVVGSGTSGAFSGGGVGTMRSLHIWGLVTNGANAGNLQFQWAQNTSNASDTTVRANSTLKTIKLA